MSHYRGNEIALAPNAEGAVIAIEAPRSHTVFLEQLIDDDEPLSVGRNRLSLAVRFASDEDVKKSGGYRLYPLGPIAVDGRVAIRVGEDMRTSSHTWTMGTSSSSDLGHHLAAHFRDNTFASATNLDLVDRGSIPFACDVDYCAAAMRGHLTRSTLLLAGAVLDSAITKQARVIVTTSAATRRRVLDSPGLDLAVTAGEDTSVTLWGARVPSGSHIFICK